MFTTYFLELYFPGVSIWSLGQFSWTKLAAESANTQHTHTHTRTSCLTHTHECIYIYSLVDHKKLRMCVSLLELFLASAKTKSFCQNRNSGKSQVSCSAIGCLLALQRVHWSPSPPLPPPTHTHPSPLKRRMPDWMLILCRWLNCLWVLMCVCVYLYVFTCACVYVRVRVCVCAWMCVCMRVFVWVIVYY